MNALTFMILIILIILFIRAQNKKKKVKILKDDVRTDDDYYAPENFYSKENYFYNGKLPVSTEDLIIAFKIKGATSGSTVDGISIRNQLMFYKDEVIAFRDKNGRLHISLGRVDEYKSNIITCLMKGYQSSEEYTLSRGDGREILYLQYKELKGTDDYYLNQPKKISLNLPDCNMELEYLDLIKNRKVGDIFSGNASIIPEEKRKEVKQLYDLWLKYDWLYKTERKESAVYSFTKNDFTKILKENNLPITGNKADLVDRIVDNLGFEKLNELGEIKDSIRLTNIGDSKIKEYRKKFKEQYILFRQEVQSLFESNQIVDACYNVTRYIETYPFNYDGSGYLYSDKELYSLCVILKGSNIFEKIGIPKEHHEAMLNTMCMYYSFVDFDYKKKLEEIYNGFEELLVESDIVINKDSPFTDFCNYINDFAHLKYSKIKLN